MDTDPTGPYWIEPASTRNLPSPAELRAMIATRLEESYLSLRRQQGDVHTPEDTFALQRALAATRERFTDWARAFRDGATRVAQMQEEQLIEAVGERVSTATQVGTGVPNQGLTVPDPGGDFRLAVDFKTERDFDIDQLIGVVAARVGQEARAAPCADIEAGSLERVIEAGIRQFAALGKFEPQITKVSAYGKQVSREGDDQLASVLSGAVTDRKIYQGVSMKRS